jgi:hypothetical protein
MQLIEVPAKTGYVWFRQGIWLFRKNPLAFLTLFFAYLLVMTLVAQIPYVGGVLPLAFIPGVAVGFMAACRDTIAGKPVFPTMLVDGFRSYGSVVAKRLLLLGLLYVAAMALVLAGSALADGGMLLKVMLGTTAMEPETIANSNITMGFLAALVFYIPVAMLFWFAPVLAAWHDVPPIKAMFFSLVSCWRNRGAFIVFGALWFVVATAVSFGLTALMQALGAVDFAVAVLMPATIIVTTMLYCVQTPDAPDLPTTPAS